jgi:2-oxoglutarate/2-oxoacid ferredoxin oxidoreductase subunit alpha
MALDMNIVIGGEAGQGVQSAGFLLSKIFSRSGFYIFADQDYESRIRGGHNFFRIRIKDTDVGAVLETIHMLVALNRETIDIHQYELSPDAFVIYDSEKIRDLILDRKLFGVPLEKLAVEKAGTGMAVNSVAIGVISGIFKLKMDVISGVFRKYFGKEDVAESNLKAMAAGYEYAEQNFRDSLNSQLTMQTNSGTMLLNGNEAIALGAIAAGCKFMAAYPMTPATTIMEYLVSKTDEYGITVVQPEDEMAAVNMIIGASFAGARAMTATSGSGFCLMVEGVGMAGISETPIVIVDAQRPGPAVGLPTRTEQGDLLFAINAHHGDFPRAVLAPSTIEEAFWLTVKAFNLAEKYQIPVIILTDHHLASSYQTTAKFDLGRVAVDRGILFSEDKHGSRVNYRRHTVTESGISPRAFPGEEDLLVITDADEHDESGHLIEEPWLRVQQVQKRMRKMTLLKNDISPPLLYGPRNAETMLISWGSTYGAVREAVNIMLEQGASISMLHISEMWPFPGEAVVKAIDSVQNCFVIEGNASGQLARLIRAETGKLIEDKILKFDGRPITPERINLELRGVL